MKRLKDLYPQICSLENLRLADARARSGKGWQRGIQEHDKNAKENLLQLQAMLIGKTYQTSAYKVFTIYEPKERQIFCLPYFPDRIAHHAIMNVLEQPLVAAFTADTYSCIKGRGIHGAANALKKALTDKEGTQYCLKLDITKFYPNVDHGIMKAQLRRKFKEGDLLLLLGGIIDSAPGLPIGNYLSQYLANFYLTDFDHWLKEVKRVRYYFRYADDMVILNGCKKILHQLLYEIKTYLAEKLRLQVKKNYQVFPVAARGIDFVGYRFFHTYILLRKTIKQSFARMLKHNANPASIAAYNGWLKHCDSINLRKTLLHEEV